MNGWITRWLERAGSLSGATPLAPIDASYGTAWWGRVPAMEEGLGRSAGRLPLVAAAHLPAF